MRGVDQFKKEAAWQRELQENINKRKVARKEKTLTKKNKSVKNAWQKTREAQKGGHKNFGGKKIGDDCRPESSNEAMGIIEANG
jgi:hypothetical protein